MLLKDKIKVGDKYNRLIVLEIFKGEKYWECLCECECKNKITTYLHGLLNNHTRSCGCLQKELTSLKFKTHGKSRTRLHRRWRNLFGRCYNKNHRQYKDYGGRGIKISKRWFKFENFLEDMGEPPDYSYTIERKNVNKGYYKSNCIWSTMKEQAVNKRNTVWLEYLGVNKPLIEWIREHDVPYKTVLQRFRNGIKPPELFSKSTRQLNKERINNEHDTG